MVFPTPQRTGLQHEYLGSGLPFPTCFFLCGRFPTKTGIKRFLELHGLVHYVLEKKNLCQVYQKKAFWVHSSTLDQFTLTRKTSTIAVINRWTLAFSWSFVEKPSRNYGQLFLLWRGHFPQETVWLIWWQFNYRWEEHPLAANQGPCEWDCEGPLIFLNVIESSPSRGKRVLSLHLFTGIHKTGCPNNFLSSFSNLSFHRYQ